MRELEMKLLRLCREAGIAYWDYVEMSTAMDPPPRSLDKHVLAALDGATFALKCACNEYTEDIRAAKFGPK